VENEIQESDRQARRCERMARVSLEELLRELPEELRNEVYDFADYLLQKRLREEERAWNKFSLTHALRGLEEEVVYTEADLREWWT